MGKFLQALAFACGFKSLPVNPSLIMQILYMHGLTVAYSSGNLDINHKFTVLPLWGSLKAVVISQTLPDGMGLQIYTAS